MGKSNKKSKTGNVLFAMQEIKNKIMTVHVKGLQ